MTEDRERSQGRGGLARRPVRWNPFRAVLSNSWWALPLGLLLACVPVAIGVLTYEPRYKAECYLSVRWDYLVFEQRAASSTNQLRRELILCWAPIVLDPVLRNEELRRVASLADPETAAANLRSNLTVEFSDSSTALIVGYTDTDPEHSAKVANAIAESYLRARPGDHNRRRATFFALLEPELKRMESAVEQKQEVVKRLTTAYAGTLSTETLESLQLASLQDIQSRILDIELEMESLPGGSTSEELVVARDVTSQDDKPADLVSSERSAKLATLEAKLKHLQERFAEEREHLVNSEFKPSNLRFAEQELEIAIDTLVKLRTRLAVMRTESQDWPTVRMLASAQAPDEPIAAMPTRRIMLASSAGFALPFLLAVFWSLVAPRRAA